MKAQIRDLILSPAGTLSSTSAQPSETMPALEHLVLPLENFLQRKKLKVPQDINSIESSF